MSAIFRDIGPVMKKRFALSHCVITLLTLFSFVEILFAGTLTPAQFRKFQGRYQGSVSGIAGNVIYGSKPVGPFSAIMNVSSKSSEVLSPLISGLYFSKSHKVVWGKPTGTTSRVVIKGVYQGTFVYSGVLHKLSGARTLTIQDRGAKVKKNRFVAQFSDTLTESELVSGRVVAAEKISGTLRR